MQELPVTSKSVKAGSAQSGLAIAIELFRRALVPSILVSVHAVVTRVMDIERRILKTLLTRSSRTISRVLCFSDIVTNYTAMFVGLNLARRYVGNSEHFRKGFLTVLVVYASGQLISLVLLEHSLKVTSIIGAYYHLLTMYLVSNLQKFALEFQAAIFLQRIADLILIPALKQLVSPDYSHALLKSKSAGTRQCLVFGIQSVFFYLIGIYHIPISIYMAPSSAVTITAIKIGVYCGAFYWIVNNTIESNPASTFDVEYKDKESFMTFARALVCNTLKNPRTQVAICLSFALLSMLPKTYLKLVQLTSLVRSVQSFGITRSPFQIIGKYLVHQLSICPGIYGRGLVWSIVLIAGEVLWVASGVHVSAYNTVLILAYPAITLAGTSALECNLISVKKWLQYYSTLNIILRMTYWREALKCAINFKTREILEVIDMFNEFMLLDLLTTTLVTLGVVHSIGALLLNGVAIGLLIGTAAYMYFIKQIYYNSGQPISLAIDE